MLTSSSIAIENKFLLGVMQTVVPRRLAEKIPFIRHNLDTQEQKVEKKDL